MKQEAAPSANNNEKKQAIKPPSPMRILISLLIQNPKLIKFISHDDPLFKNKIPGMSLLNKIALLLQDNAHFGTANIMEHFRDHADYKHVAKLAVWEHPIAKEGIEIEFQDCLKYIKHFENEQKMQNSITYL